MRENSAAFECSDIILTVGVTPEMACSYIEGRQEQLLVLRDPTMHNPTGYQKLLRFGFRRSGSEVYRPRCQHCQACRPIRLSPKHVQLSRSQKRVLRKNQDITIRLSYQHKESYYQLYECYINSQHGDGSMYPASRDQYDGFILCDWLDPIFIEFYLDTTLVAVAVTDLLPQNLSAMYCFYDTAYRTRSLGTLAILKQLAFAKQWHKKWLYLGYQVNQCPKMSYKSKFKPNDQLILGEWRTHHV